MIEVDPDVPDRRVRAQRKTQTEPKASGGTTLDDLSLLGKPAISVERWKCGMSCCSHRGLAIGGSPICPDDRRLQSSRQCWGERLQKVETTKWKDTPGTAGCCRHPDAEPPGLTDGLHIQALTGPSAPPRAGGRTLRRPRGQDDVLPYTASSPIEPISLTSSVVHGDLGQQPFSVAG